MQETIKRPEESWLYDTILEELKRMPEVRIVSAENLEPKHVGIFRNVRYTGHINYKSAGRFFKKLVRLDSLLERLKQNSGIPRATIQELDGKETLFYKKEIPGTEFYDEVLVYS